MKENSEYPAGITQNSFPSYMLVFKLAHAYVPFQHLGCIYPPLIGLKQGTIFPELDRPYGADPEYMEDA